MESNSSLTAQHLSPEIAADLSVIGIIYASVADSRPSAKHHLQTSVSDFVATCGASDSIIWSLSYAVSGPDPTSEQDAGFSEISPQVFSFTPRPYDLSLPDDVLISVKSVWNSIQGADAQDDTFLRLGERESEAEND